MNTVGDVYELAIKQTYQGSVLTNVLHFKHEFIIADQAAEYLALANEVKDALRVNQSVNLAYTGWTMRQVAGAGVTYDPATCKRSGGDVFEGLFTAPTAGSLSTTTDGDSFSAMVAALKTGLSGRSRRGRIFVGGFLVGERTGNLWSAGRTSGVQTALDAIKTAHGAAAVAPHLRWVVFSRQIASGCKPNTVHPHHMTTFATPNAAGSYAAINAVVCSNVIAPLHRRKLGVGV